MGNLFEAAGIATVILASSRYPNEYSAQPKATTGSSGNNPKSAGDVSADATQSGKLSQLLTLRQLQIVAMLKRGSSNREIAQVLGLAEGTVKVHLHSIYQRIGVSNRRELTAKLAAEPTPPRP